MATLAFEIGTEEIPAFDLKKAMASLTKLANDKLQAANVAHGEVEVFSSPRRMIVIAHDVPEATEAKHETYRGPKKAIAYDEQGNPTKAAISFAKGKGLTPDDLTVEDFDGEEYIVAHVDVPSVDVKSLLPEVLDGIVRGIAWRKSQRWGSESEYFSRPIRWFVALLGSEVIPFEFAGLTAGRQTYGHRFLAPGPFELADADSLIDTLRGAMVVPSEAEREAVIREGVAAIEKETGYTCVLHPNTLTEVINLAEYPTCIMGTFDEEFLDVPEEIIVDAMLVHQRYFPLYDEQGKLTNHFVVVSNGDPAYAETIVDGNERVVRARLYDAKFFYDEDLKAPLESYVAKLDEVVFQEKLGTMLAKTERIEKLAAHLAADAGLSQQESDDAVRAAHLCKADLVTQAVVEFTSVQGIMGSYYALAAGANPAVAQAVDQHYQPRFATDELPETAVGKVVATADKLDTICGMFAIDQAPTGSSDPFALRRSAIGIVNMLRAGLDVSLQDAISAALDGFTNLEFDKAAVAASISEFFITRTKVMLKDEGASVGAVDAVLACGVDEPAEVVRRTRSLEAARSEMPEVMEDLAVAYARANNLRDEALGLDVSAEGLGAEETALLAATDAAKEQVEQCLANNDYDAALRALAGLREPIDAFFADVLIMDEDQQVREGRLKLLNRFASVFTDLAYFALL